MKRSKPVLAILFLVLVLSTVWAKNQILNRNTFVGQETGSNFGYALATGDFNNDGLADLIVGAPYASHQGNSTGRVFLYYGNTRQDKESDVIISGTEEYEYLGRSVSSAGDFNGDGFEDFIVGADGFDNNKGLAFIYFGGPQFDIYPDVRLENSSASSFGTIVAKLGDVNGDGFDDVAVADASQVYVFFGNPNKSGNDYQIISGYGNRIAYCGDVNGDGFDDVLVGYPQTNGQAVVLLGGTTWDGTPDVYMKAPMLYDQFATAVAGGADVNGDGYCDILIGAENDGTRGSKAGAFYLYLGGPDMINSNHSFGYAPSLRFYGDSANVRLGHTVGFTKDMDGDGFPEILAGEYRYWYSPKANRAFVYKGGRTIKTAPYRILHGEEGNAAYYFGAAFASDDFNGDGYGDIFVSSYGLDKVFMFENKPTGTENIPDLIITNNDANNFGYSLDANGDFNGDGYDDIIAGDYYHETYAPNKKPLNIYFGGPNMDGNPDIVLDFDTYPNKYIRFVGDVNGDGYTDFVGINDQHQAKLVFGAEDTPLESISLAINEHLIWEAINYGDFNGDGFSDVVLSSASNAVDSFFVYYGGRDMDGMPDLKTGNSNNSFFNDRVACLDINGDGYEDMLVAFKHTYYEQVWLGIYLGSPDGLFYFNSINPQDLEANSEFWDFYAVGDVNNDGFQDLWVELSGEENNQLLVLFGNGALDHFDFKKFPQRSSTIYSIGYMGDITGDGIDDLGLIENNYNTYRISVYGGGALNLDFPVNYYQYLNDDNFSYRVASGDLNGDGVQDILSSNSDNKIYLYFSSPVNAAPRLTAVKDVPADQGGKVSVVWFKSGWEGGRVQSYRIERSIAPAGNGFAWETIATVKANGNNYYSYTAATLSDQVEGYNGNIYFRISALDGDGATVAHSAIKYGHSVDNLAPAAVQNLQGQAQNQQVRLSWKANSENDLKEYHVFRSISDRVDVDTLAVYATVTDTTFIDGQVPASDMYYFVRAVDVHGNSGQSASWLYSATAIDDAQILPTAFKLEQNFPNPFNPQTTIRYQLPKAVQVDLTVFNALGQKVAVLVKGKQAPGTYTVKMNGALLPSGVYFYRLKAGNVVLQRKMLLMK